MAQSYWFTPIETMFYDALDYHNLSEWYIEPMPDDMDTHRAALVQGQRKWPFRTHNGRGKFKCHNCKKEWKSSFTTVIWRARWSTGTVQVRIEKQGCQRCNIKCQGSLTDESEIEFAMEWMCSWILEVFYGIQNEESDSGDDEPNENEAPTAPHDTLRCEAGRKGTCRKCNRIRRALNQHRT